MDKYFQSNILDLSVCYISLLNQFICHNKQVHPLCSSESQNPQEVINIGGLTSDTRSSQGTQHQSNQAFVVGIFLRENPDMQTIQPGQEQESRVCCLT